MKKLFSLGSSIDAAPDSALREEFLRAPANRKPRRLFNGGLPLILFGLATLPLLAQPGPVSVRPDCFQFFTFTATGNGLTFDNRSAGCPYFAIAYSSNGFSVESLVVQVAPDAGGTPGTWVTYTANSGINPNTAITQAFSTFSGYFPWVRVQLTSVTGSGSIQGVLYGWRTPAAIIAGGGTSGGCPGTAGTPCVVDGPTAAGSPPTTAPVLISGQDGTNIQTLKTDTGGDPQVVGPTPAGSPPTTAPVMVAGSDGVNVQTLSMDTHGGILPGFVRSTTGDGQSDLTTAFGSTSLGLTYNLTRPWIFNGATWDRQVSCTNRANITLTTIGLTRIITGTSAKKIRLCSLSMSFASPVDVQVVEGTQAVTACDTGATNMTGLYRSVVGFDPNLSNLFALTEGTAADDVCISMSASVNGGGTAIYAVF